MDGSSYIYAHCIVESRIFANTLLKTLALITKKGYLLFVLLHKSRLLPSGQVNIDDVTKKKKGALPIIGTR